MAGFDLTSLLNQLTGKRRQRAPEQGRPGQPGQPGQSGQSGQPGAPGEAPAAVPGRAGGPLSGGMLGKLAPMIGALVGGGGLAKLMDQLKAGGLGAQANSWVSTDQANQPVTGDQLTRALGEDQISSFADTLGMSKEQAAQTMASALPHVVDAMTPDGTLPQPSPRPAGPPRDVHTSVDRPTFSL